MRNRPLALAFRPLVAVSVLVGGDYLLWSWSSQGNHDVVALVSGLTMTPLAIALIWLLALNAARLVAQLARPEQRRRQRQQSLRHGPRGHEEEQEQQQRSRQHERGEQAASSSKLAA